MVLGNHETESINKQYNPFKDLPTRINGLSILNETMKEIDNFQFWGKCYPFKKPLKQFPVFNRQKPIITITHEPPLNIMDYGIRARQLLDGTFFHAGRKEITTFVNKIQPDVHCFGHCHSSHGTLRKGKTLFVNGSIVDDNNTLAHTPIVLDYVHEKFIERNPKKCITLKKFISLINENPKTFLAKSNEFQKAFDKTLHTFN